MRRRGRFARYRTMPRIEIPVSVGIPTCRSCGVEWVDDSTARLIDRALDTVYREELVRRTKAAIGELSHHATNQQLERLLGLSHGYVSKLKSGDRVPSPDLVAELGLLAHKPVPRLRELEAYWRAPTKKAG
jgi:hypothetical protein